MSTEINFKALWTGQKIEMPGPETLKETAQRFRKKQLRKMAWLNIVLLLTIVYFFAIGYSSATTTVLTWIGFSIITIAIVGYLIFHNRTMASIMKLDLGTSNREYLQRLVRIKKRQTIVYTKITAAYFLLLTAGLFISLWSPLQHLSPPYRIMAVLLTIGWILFVWFYLRPRAVTRQNKKIDPLIKAYAALANQFDENN